MARRSRRGALAGSRGGAPALLPSARVRHAMTAFLVRRAVGLVVTLWLASLVVFLVLQVLPALPPAKSDRGSKMSPRNTASFDIINLLINFLFIF